MDRAIPIRWVRRNFLDMLAGTNGSFTELRSDDGAVWGYRRTFLSLGDDAVPFPRLTGRPRSEGRTQVPREQRSHVHGLGGVHPVYDTALLPETALLHSLRLELTALRGPRRGPRAVAALRVAAHRVAAHRVST